jgi:hypothetical protein
MAGAAAMATAIADVMVSGDMVEPLQISDRNTEGISCEGAR